MHGPVQGKKPISRFDPASPKARPGSAMHVAAGAQRTARRAAGNRPFLCAILSVLILHGCGRPAVAPAFASPPVDGSAPQGLPPETVGYLLYDPRSGRIVEQFQRRRPLIPASTTKVLTVGAALDLLGPDFRFSTDLLYRGYVDDGLLTGDLILAGGEDPELHVRDLLDLVDALKRKGIREIQGRFLYVDHAPLRRERIDDGMEDEAAYNPAISSLSLESNVLFLRWRRSGPVTEAYFVPSLPGTQLSQKEKDPTEADEREIIFEAPASARRPLQGQQGEGWTLLRPKQPEGMRPLPVKNAGAYTARVFRLLCQTRGIHLPEPAATATVSGTHIARHTSRPLREIGAQIFATSDNAMTELVLLRTAAATSGRYQTLPEAAETLRRHLLARIHGLDSTGLQLRNGSGLTSENRISAEQLLAGLLYADAVSGPGGIESMLPVGGWSQGLQGRLNRPEELFRVVAKPGGIFYSVTLTGFLYPASGRRLAFAILISDLALRRRYEALTDRRSRRRALEANAWMRQNREALDGILADWIKRH